MYSGFWRRFWAFLVDAVLATTLALAIAWLLLGDDVVQRFFSESRQDFDSSLHAFMLRNSVEILATMILVLTGSLLEASPLRASLGKALFGMAVVDGRGRRLSPLQSLGRNTMKVISTEALGLGCLAVGLSPTKQGWHDHLAKTFVVDRRGPAAAGRRDPELEKAATLTLRSFAAYADRDGAAAFDLERELAKHLPPSRIPTIRRDRRLGALLRFLSMYRDALAYGFPDVTKGVDLPRAAEMVRIMVEESTEAQVHVVPKVFAWGQQP